MSVNQLSGEYGCTISCRYNRNVHSAIQVLHEKGLKVIVADSGGPFSRELYFDFQTGEVHVRKFRISVKLIGGDHE